MTVPTQNPQGYVCPSCGMWVGTNSYHVCTVQTTPQPTLVPDWNSILGAFNRVASALERCAVALEEKKKDAS